MKTMQLRRTAAVGTLSLVAAGAIGGGTVYALTRPQEPARAPITVHQVADTASPSMTATETPTATATASPATSPTSTESPVATTTTTAASVAPDTVAATPPAQDSSTTPAAPVQQVPALPVMPPPALAQSGNAGGRPSPAQPAPSGT